ncbi:MAG TPA: alkaline phosphatase family protein [Blastocatellia bacterium]|nr:alkaline phosphatase family protein [Blastocatellia bacterium]
MKTVIIGLDGATFDIIEPLASAGRLPVLSRLMREGVSAPLRSTILPNSFPGWASCTTGTSEGMHGVFSPFIKNPSRYTVRTMSGRDIMTRPVWDILTEHGGRSIVLNVPTTYPPEPINGLMVTGMLTPGRGSAFTHPASLKNELLAEFPNYVIEPERIPDKHARANEFRRTIEVRERALKFLMQRGEWDFLMVVFSVLDRAQHDYWADMDPEHPRHDPNTPREFREFIHEIYQRLDSAVGKLIEQVPAETRVLVVSDHGFCSELFEVRVNELLASAGLLQFKSPASRKSIARVRSFKSKVARRFSPVVPNGNVLDRKVEYGSAFLDEIDWSRTRAFFAQDKGVWINLAGREGEGVVRENEFDGVIEDARSALLELVSPQDGEPVFESVMRREEAFNGAWSSNLPDLVMVTRRDEYVYNERPSYGDVIVPADSTTGTHSRDGIFIAWGRDIKTGATLGTQPNLRDVGPTALASLGCPLTTDMDGRALMEVFNDSAEPQRQGSSYKTAAPTSEALVHSVYNASEETELRERLKALGYIE